MPAVKTWKAISSVWKRWNDQVILLARQVAKKIEDELDYPGQIKVSVIRESRATEYAK